jgi:hypothetical protein
VIASIIILRMLNQFAACETGSYGLSGNISCLGRFAMVTCNPDKQFDSNAYSG